jgi:outer membrane lipoprotein-sorting protein
MRFAPTLLRLLFPLGLIAAASSLHADDALISKARSFIGPEASLQAVESLRMMGELQVVDGAADSAGTAKIEILFQKPDRQRITATSDSRTEITALDGYDAWSRVSDPQDPSLWQVTLLGPAQIKRLRANTFENLAFFRDLESRGARVEDRGLATVDGVACRRLAFVHGPDIIFIRSFDLATGRLVLTETDSGTQIREEGEMRSGGLRFPKQIVTVNTLENGEKRTIRVTFTEITVNPALDPQLFALPSLGD